MKKLKLAIIVNIKYEDLILEEVKELQLAAIDQLIRSSKLEGYNFLERLERDWRLGLNRFQNKGEVLFTVRYNDQIVAIGGVNQDPYKDDSNIGRIRHIYVAPNFRRQGIGKFLVQRILEYCNETFRQITLRTDNPNADKFYINLGFYHVSNFGRDTHVIMIQ